MMRKCNKIKEFIENKIHETHKSCEQTADPMAKLKFAITEVSFAHILSQYLDSNSHTYSALLHLAQVYVLNQSYSQALIQARLARKQAEDLKDGSKERATLLMAQCMVKQKKFEDAHQILRQLNLPQHAQDCQQNLYQLLLEVQSEVSEEPEVYGTLQKLQQVVRRKWGQKSIQFGLLLYRKGKTIGHFGNYKQAISNINQGVEILIEKKCKQKKQMAQIYLTLADYYKKQNSLDKQYSSLICAHSMAKQLQDSHKQILPIIHMIAANLIEREEYGKALKQLKVARNMEKQIYGESSVQIGKTVKKITELLTKLNLKLEAKKYEQEYSRIIGPGSSVLKQKQTNQKAICA